MKPYLLALLALASSSSMAGVFSASAVPTGIDIVQAGTAGFMVYGEFGNAAGCTAANQFFVKSTHPQYDRIYAAALAAFTAGKKVSVYVSACEPVGWYSVPSVTYSVVNDNASLSIRE